MNEKVNMSQEDNRRQQREVEQNANEGRMDDEVEEVCGARAG